jgi:hypothetical protein
MPDNSRAIGTHSQWGVPGDSGSAGSDVDINKVVAAMAVRKGLKCMSVF